MKTNNIGFFQSSRSTPVGYQELLQQCSNCIAAKQYDKAYQYISLALYLIDSHNQINSTIQIDFNAHLERLWLLAKVASHLKQRQQAIAAYSDIIKLVQTLRQQNSELFLIEQKKIEDQLSATQQKALAKRGICYKKEGHHELALADFDQSLAISPNDVKTLFNRMKAHFQLTQYQEALADIEQILIKQPNNIDIYMCKSAILNLQNDHIAALAVINKALNISPGNTQLLLEVAKIRLALKQPEIAQQVIEYLHAIHPNCEIPEDIIAALKALSAENRLIIHR